MELMSVGIGVVIGLALAAIGVSSAKILAWVEAKIKLVEAQTASHLAVANVSNARATAMTAMTAPSPALTSTAAAAPAAAAPAAPSA
jgi:hypothetical protein